MQKTILQTLPPDGITVGGWMKQQIREDATNGWVPTCNAMSHQGIMEWDPNSGIIVPRFPASYPPYKEWLYSGRRGWKWNWSMFVPYYQPLIEKTGFYGEGEFQAHWMDMLFRQVWVGNAREHENLARQCIADILANTDASGYLGVNDPTHRLRGTYVTPFHMNSGNFENSGMGSIFDAFLTYYRLTGDKKVLDALIKGVDLMLDANETMGRSACGLMAMPLAKLYVLTGNRTYLERADELWTHTIGAETKGPFANETFTLRGQHCAAAGINSLAALEMYRATGGKKYLDWALSVHEQIVRYALQSHGAPTGNGEYVFDAGPSINTEGCDTAWWSWVWMDLLEITGETKFADLAERAILNALPGGRSKDGRASPYFMRPNQLFAARSSGQGTVYGVRFLVECCLGNMGRVMPILAEHMILSTADGGFAVPFYGPCVVTGDVDGAGRVTVSQKTDYPFSEKIEIGFKIEKGQSTFPIRLRKPAWCDTPGLQINGKPVGVDVKNGWIELNRTWKSGDVINLSLPMNIRVDLDKNGLAVVSRGPLLYTLPVQGRREPVDQWGSFEEVVTTESKWNYALALNTADPASSFRVKNLTPKAGVCVWEQPGLGLEVDAYRLADWKFDKPIADVMPELSTDAPEPPVPPKPFKTEGKKETILLVPYGYTILRMTHLPVIAEKERKNDSRHIRKNTHKK